MQYVFFMWVCIACVTIKTHFVSHTSRSWWAPVIFVSLDRKLNSVFIDNVHAGNTYQLTQSIKIAQCMICNAQNEF